MLPPIEAQYFEFTERKLLKLTASDTIIKKRDWVRRQSALHRHNIQKCEKKKRFVLVQLPPSYFHHYCRPLIILTVIAALANLKPLQSFRHAWKAATQRTMAVVMIRGRPPRAKVTAARTNRRARQLHLITHRSNSSRNSTFHQKRKTSCLVARCLSR